MRPGFSRSYDIPIGRTVGLTPFVNGVGISKYSGAITDLGQIGLAISLH